VSWIKWLLEPKSTSHSPNQAVTTSDAQAVQRLIHDYLERNGGLDEVVKRFEASGFISKVRSWVSAGPNQPINSVEVLQLFGLRSLGEMANKVGIPLDRLRDLLAELLPVVIDQRTPQGKL
jgi:uncharacterized protein YidB (DUF937 family)